MYKESLIFSGYSGSYDEWKDFFESHLLNDIELSTLLNIYVTGYFSICKRDIALYEYHSILNICKNIGSSFMHYLNEYEDMMYELLLFDIYYDYDDNQVFVLKDEIINVIDYFYPDYKAMKDNLDIDQVRKEEIICIKEFLNDRKVDHLLEIRKHYIEINYNEIDFS